jgi:adenylate cyclase
VGERFESESVDLFASQNEITSRIALALDVELITAEAARSTEHPDALDYILCGRAVSLRPPTPNSGSKAINLFERALALDLQSVEAQSRLAAMLVNSVLIGMADSAAADLARAEGLVYQALAASPRAALVHLVKGHLLRAQHRYAEAIREYETVLASNRNSVHAMFALGQCKLFTGMIEESIPLIEQAIRLSPRDPVIGRWHSLIGFVHLLQSSTDEAIVWLEKARSAMPAQPIFLSFLASAYALNDEIERAAAELSEARRLNADGRYSRLVRVHKGSIFNGVARPRRRG